jgi:hypothetical protein
MKVYLKTILLSFIYTFSSYHLMASCIWSFSSSSPAIQCPDVFGNLNGIDLTINIEVNFTDSNDELFLNWQYKRNNGSWQTFLSENIKNPPSSITRSHSTNQVGIYQYRVDAFCVDTDGNYSVNDITYTITRTLGDKALNPNCDLLYDLSRAVAKITVPGISSSFSGFLINNSLNDGRLLFMTSAKPFACSSYNLNNATFTWNEQQNNCNSLTQVSSTGATLLATDGYIALLELNGPLPLEEYVLLGWNKNIPSSVVSIFQSSNSNVKKGMAKGGSIPSFWEYYNLLCDGTFNNDMGTGEPAVKIEHWSQGGGFDDYSRGAPLISGNRAVGVYLSSHNISECTYGPSLGALLNNTSLFDQFLAPNNATSASSILFEPCEDEIVESNPVTIPRTYKANIRVIGSSKIDNVLVIFQADEEVILLDGFDSGNNFIAEIVPCIPDFTVINPKPEPEGYITEHFKNSETENFSNLRSNTIDIKAYPTVEVEDRITIEVSGLTELDYTIVSLEGKVIKKSKLLNVNQNFSEIITLPSMAAGGYFLVLRSNLYSETIKLIKK